MTHRHSVQTLRLRPHLFCEGQRKDESRTARCEPHANWTSEKKKVYASVEKYYILGDAGRTKLSSLPEGRPLSATTTTADPELAIKGAYLQRTSAKTFWAALYCQSKAGLARGAPASKNYPPPGTVLQPVFVEQNVDEVGFGPVGQVAVPLKALADDGTHGVREGVEGVQFADFRSLLLQILGRSDEKAIK